MPHTRAPSCMCGLCCFWHKRDGVVSRRDAQACGKWRRRCQNGQGSKCTHELCRGGSINWIIVLGVQIQRASFTATVVFNPSVKAVQQHCQPIGHCEKDYMNGEENESVLSFLPVRFNEVAGRADILFDVLECQKSSGSLHYHFFCVRTMSAPVCLRSLLPCDNFFQCF